MTDWESIENGFYDKSELTYSVGFSKQKNNGRAPWKLRKAITATHTLKNVQFQKKNIFFSSVITKSCFCFSYH